MADFHLIPVRRQIGKSINSAVVIKVETQVDPAEEIIFCEKKCSERVRAVSERSDVHFH